VSRTSPVGASRIQQLSGAAGAAGATHGTAVKESCAGHEYARPSVALQSGRERADMTGRQRGPKPGTRRVFAARGPAKTVSGLRRAVSEIDN
jgi:hypothetical protein